jgi:hypothetical protein
MELNDLMSNLFTNKNVAIVGPALYMSGSKLGKEIDEYDTVVRLNRSCESILEYSQDIGNRTDVLYSCLIEKPANAGIINVEKFKDYGIKLVCAPPASNMKGLSNTTRLHELIDLKKIEKLSKEIPVRVVDHNFHNKLALQVDCRPNTGYMAIYDIIRMGPSKLGIYGFSFYLDGFIKGVKSGIIQEQNKSEEEFAEQCFNSKRHVQKNMWEYAKKTLVDNENVKLDKFLTKILDLDCFSRKSFKETLKW